MYWATISATFLGLYLLYKLIMRFRIGRCTSNADLSGKTAIVTGATQGIGFHVALDLATRNAKVILASRRGPDATAAVRRIQQETGNEKVLHRHVDLSSLTSVRTFCSEVLKEENRLDILINNAGILGHSKAITDDGLETNMATNYFGPFLLTNLLLDLLKKSAPSRVIVTSSLVHDWGHINFDNLNAEKSFNSATIYFDSKLAIMLFARELSRKLGGTGLTMNALHPGSVQTKFFDSLPVVIREVTKAVSWLFFRTPEEGAQTTIYLAVSEEVADITGRYFSECRQTQPSHKAQDDAIAKKLWEVSEQLTGLS